MTSPDLYDAHYFDTMRDSGALYDKFLALLDDADRPLSRLRVLDVGCGRGELVEVLARRGAAAVAGFDFSQSAVAASEARLANVGHDRLSIKQGTIEDKSLYEPGSFDAAFMTDIVEHLPQQVLERGLANAATWLAPEGFLFVHTFPTLGPHRLSTGLLRAVGQGRRVARMEAVHCNVQTRARLRRTLEGASLECRRMWLENDVPIASNEYHMLRDGLAKRKLGLFAGGLLNSRPAIWFASALGRPNLSSLRSTRSAPARADARDALRSFRRGAECFLRGKMGFRCGPEPLRRGRGGHFRDRMPFRGRVGSSGARRKASPPRRNDSLSRRKASRPRRSATGAPRNGPPARPGGLTRLRKRRKLPRPLRDRPRASWGNGAWPGRDGSADRGA